MKCIVTQTDGTVQTRDIDEKLPVAGLKGDQGKTLRAFKKLFSALRFFYERGIAVDVKDTPEGPEIQIHERKPDQVSFPE